MRGTNIAVPYPERSLVDDGGRPQSAFGESRGARDVGLGDHDPNQGGLSPQVSDAGSRGTLG